MSEEKKMPNNATKEASEVALQDFTEDIQAYIDAINNYVESINNQDNVEHNLLRLASMCSLAYLRIRDYDAFFLKKEEVKSEADSTEVESETNSKE